MKEAKKIEPICYAKGAKCTFVSSVCVDTVSLGFALGEYFLPHVVWNWLKWEEIVWIITRVVLVVHFSNVRIINFLVKKEIGDGTGKKKKEREEGGAMDWIVNN